MMKIRCDCRVLLRIFLSLNQYLVRAADDASSVIKVPRLYRYLSYMNANIRS